MLQLRTAGRQCHRDNIDHSSVEEYYRRSIVIPLLDNLIQQMEDRFSNTKVMASKLLCLVPSELVEVSNESFEDVASFYTSDLPNPLLLDVEVWRWRTKWASVDIRSRPATLQEALKECSEDYFSNIHVLLQIACTLPVTSCENERAHSTFKNLKTFLRSTMGQERLSSLALMHIHYKKPVDHDDIIDRFKAMSSRRISL